MLDGWDKNKIIKLQLDQVDEELTDFPVLINLDGNVGVGSGKTGYDCSDLFEDLYDELFNNLTSPPIHYYNLNNNVDDSIGSNNGTLITGYDNNGYWNQCIASSNETIYQSGMELSPTTFKSISFWARRPELIDIYAFCGGIGAQENIQSLIFHRGDGNYALLFNNIVSDFIVDDINWHHIVITEGSTPNYHWIYFDGVKNSVEIQSDLNGQIQYFGYKGVLSSAYRGGYIDEILIFDYMLSDYDVNFIYEVKSYYVIPVPKKIAVEFPAYQEHWIDDVYNETFTPEYEYDLGFDNDGYGGLFLYGTVTQYSTYCSFQNSGLEEVDHDSSNMAIKAIFRIRNKNKGINQTIVKDGGLNNGRTLAIDSSGNLGVFGRANDVFTSIIIPIDSYDNNVWYECWSTDTRLMLLNYETKEILYDIAGVCNSTNGGGDFSIAFSNDSSIIDFTSVVNGEFFDGDIAYIATQGYMGVVFPVSIKGGFRSYNHGSQEECYLEIENYDYDNKTAQIWCRTPKLLADQPTDIYLHYDINHADNTDYVGNTGDATAQNVWDSYHAVYHMNNDTGSTVIDSTSNLINGTPNVGLLSKDGYIGKGLDFSDDDDIITIPTISLTNSILVFESIFEYPLPTSVSYNTLIRGFETSDNHQIIVEVSSQLLGCYTTTTAFNSCGFDMSTLLAGRHTIAIRSDGITIDFYIDGQAVGTVTIDVNSTISTIGNTAGGASQWSPTIDETRISLIDRSYSWVSVTNDSNIDNLISYSTYSPYIMSGYVYEQGDPVQREVALYERNSMQLQDKMLSNIDGSYTLSSSTSGAHIIICKDDETDEIVYDDLVITKFNLLER